MADEVLLYTLRYYLDEWIENGKIGTDFCWVRTLKGRGSVTMLYGFDPNVSCCLWNLHIFHMGFIQVFQLPPTTYRYARSLIGYSKLLLLVCGKRFNVGSDRHMREKKILDYRGKGKGKMGLLEVFCRELFTLIFDRYSVSW